MKKAARTKTSGRTSGKVAKKKIVQFFIISKTKNTPKKKKEQEKKPSTPVPVQVSAVKEKINKQGKKVAPARKTKRKSTKKR